MKLTNILLPLAALSMTAAPAFASEAAPKAQAEASIAFVNQGGLRDWTAGKDDRTVYFQDRARNWYRAELFAPVPDLQFRQGIGIDTNGFSSLDKWGAILVHGARYPFASFERVDGPPERS